MNQREHTKKLFEEAIEGIDAAERNRIETIHRIVKKARKRLLRGKPADAIVEQLFRDLLPQLPAEAQTPLAAELLASAENPNRLLGGVPTAA
jgi:hypothetical protein